MDGHVAEHFTCPYHLYQLSINTNLYTCNAIMKGTNRHCSLLIDIAETMMYTVRVNWVADHGGTCFWTVFIVIVTLRILIFLIPRLIGNLLN